MLFDMRMNISGMSWAVAHLLADKVNPSQLDQFGEPEAHVSLTPFYNGRERGFCVSVNYAGRRFTVAWAEAKLSDQLHVYHWEEEFKASPPSMMDCPIPEEGDYEIFSPTTTHLAAASIHKQLEEWWLANWKPTPPARLAP
jgi:hypothetical protein